MQLTCAEVVIYCLFVYGLSVLKHQYLSEHECAITSKEIQDFIFIFSYVTLFLLQQSGFRVCER